MQFKKNVNNILSFQFVELALEEANEIDSVDEDDLCEHKFILKFFKSEKMKC